MKTATTDLRTRLCFAAGGTATGLVQNGIAFFLLIFYSQVMGLSPDLAGLAMLIALLVDAITDPMVGRWSDSLHSRWGRRHPLMYASIIPITILYYAIWVPDTETQTGLFWYMVLVAIGLRISVTFFAVPFAAMVPEMTPDYEQRTRLINYNTSAGWLFGTVMAVAMYAVWLADTPEYPDGMGVLRAAGYAEAGLFTAAIIGLCLVIAVLGTHRHIESIRRKPIRKVSGFGELLRATFRAFDDRSFLAMAVSGVFAAAGNGTSVALWAYMQPYFWGFNSEQVSVILASQLLSAFLAFGLLDLVSRGREKKQVWILLTWLLIIVSTAPVCLALIGWFPAIGSDSLYLTMIVLGIIQVMLIIMTSVVGVSMLADIVEARELVTGEREEGTLLAVQSFINKAATGLGTLAGGLVLALVAFPEDTMSTDIDPQVIENLGWAYGPLLGIIYIASIVAVHFYQLDRETHQANLRQLSAT